MVTTGVLFATGDILAQAMFPHVDHLDNDNPEEHKDTSLWTTFHYPRTLRAMIYGSFFFAPISVMWQTRKLPLIKNPFIHRYRQIWPHSKIHFYDSTWRLSIDQLFMPSLVWIPLYNTVMTVLALHDNPLHLAKEKLENNWWRVLKASWTVWPAFQFANLMWTPVHLRIVAANLWSVGWNCFLSFVHNTKGHGKGSGKKLEELVDIETDDEEQTMVYS
ncbi:uncharacterized protein KQ657_001443 [Scheffersomyces spartinae]|uniref:Protein SYM1 n=1 Tax=Scheffersomyces spartinae TaxID=45513 RepID=A0A9P7V7S3_9ASCO|nr:uncharacterized protein KQ657_001443 [Scheffersomyces spartinae]KAG7192663.1 hypothetical protein KQ657_001443 [Scheffersomyces spartinae]